MGLKVKDLFDLEIFRNFKLVAGEGGLDRQISGTEILDFEFVQGAGMSREHVFEGNSITLSSLLFAKDDPAKLFDAIKRLNELGVSCFAYKPALVKKLPEEALRYADENNFPILEFGGDEFFEDIIVAVKDEIGAGEDICEIERSLENIVNEELSDRDVYKFVRRLNPKMKKYIRVVGIRDKSKTTEQIVNMARRLASVERIANKVTLCKFREGYLIILSQDEVDINRFDALLTDVFIALDIDKNSINCGFSLVRKRDGEFSKCITEAFWACIVSIIEGGRDKYYNDIGIYRFIIPEINSEHIDVYMREYLGPILDEKDELLDTAKAYILSRGDIIVTSQKLFCHKNTVRYRLAKIQELLDPNSNEKEFYSNLSLAIRVKLLQEYR